MALSIITRLRDGRYDAAALRPSDTEWPPHPARVFCALVASASEAADWQALSWLERAGVPHVWASPLDETTVSRRAAYVVTNAAEKTKGNLTWPGRSNGYQQRTGVMPADREFALVWPDADPDDAVLGRLVRLARRVPYVGRSTSSVELTVLPEAVEPKPSWTVYRPAPLDAEGARRLRVPYPGYVDALRSAYERGDRAWELSRSRAYVSDAEARVPPAPEPDAAVVPGPYQDLLIWAIRRGRVGISGDRAVAVTEALRRAVMSRVDRVAGGGIPPLVSGHGADGQPHVAYLALPYVGSEHADGHVLGVGVAVPHALHSRERAALLRALLDEADPLTALSGPWREDLELEYRPERTEPRGLVPERWTAGRRGARRWVSVTPVMLDRFPKRNHDVAALVARSLVTAGYPEPQAVDILPATAVRGGVHRPRAATVPEGRHRRPFVHCRVDFTSPVIGPVIAGALRYLGIGLFVPEWSRDAS